MKIIHICNIMLIIMIILLLVVMVPVSTKDLLPWLDRIFSTYICDDKGFPKVKTHGFGLTTSLMIRYPWYSVRFNILGDDRKVWCDYDAENEAWKMGLAYCPI